VQVFHYMLPTNTRHQIMSFVFGISQGHPLCIVACPFVLFLLTIVLSVRLRYTDSDYPFGIFKLFMSHRCRISERLLKISKVFLKYTREYRRRTDNTMVKRKSTKGQATIAKTYI
jgi:hypothetical protein